MRILFVSPFLPWPPNLGVALRMGSLIRALELCGNVECVFFGNRRQIDSVPAGVLPKVIAVLPPPDPREHSMFRWLLRRVPDASLEWWLSYVPFFPILFSLGQHHLAKFAAIRPQQYDLVVFVRIPTLWWLKWQPIIPTLVDIDDVMHLGLEQAYLSEKHPVKRLLKWWHYKVVKRAEMTSLELTTGAFVCSDADAVALAYKKIAVLPNVFPDRGQIEREPPVTERPIILFVGALVYKPNREAIEYFVNRIFPRIREMLPDAVLLIAGRTAPREEFDWAKRPGVEFLGTVPDLDPIIEASAIEVCPILYGLGTRIKILEALSFGKPVVSTTIGAHGISLDESSGLFRADEPDAFADVCVSLLSNLNWRRAISRKAREAVRVAYSQARVNSVVAASVFNIAT